MERYLDKLKMFRDICPNIQFSSDFIVGFPNETEEDFEATFFKMVQVGRSKRSVMMAKTPLDWCQVN